MKGVTAGLVGSVIAVSLALALWVIGQDGHAEPHTTAPHSAFGQITRPKAFGSVSMNGQASLVASSGNSVYYIWWKRTQDHVVGQIEKLAIGPWVTDVSPAEPSTSDIGTTFSGALTRQSFIIPLAGNAFGISTLRGQIRGNTLIVAMPSQRDKLTFRPAPYQASSKLFDKLLMRDYSLHQRRTRPD